MKRYFIILCLILILCHAPVWAGKRVLVIKKLWYAQYEEAFKSSKKHLDYESEFLDINGLSNAETRQEIRAAGTALILAIGLDAYLPFKNIAHTPVVWAYADEAKEKYGATARCAGVSIHLPPAAHIGAIRGALPAARRIGLIYTTETRHMIREAKKAAKKAGLGLTAIEAKEGGDVPEILDKLGSGISVFWMLPNYDLWNKTTLNSLFIYSKKKSIPVVTYSKGFMKWGAFMMVSSHPKDVGRLLAQIIRDVLNEKDVEAIGVVRPEKLRIIIHTFVSKDFSITVPREFLNKAEKYP